MSVETAPFSFERSGFFRELAVVMLSLFPLRRISSDEKPEVLVGCFIATSSALLLLSFSIRLCFSLT